VRHYLLLCRKNRNARVRAKTLSYPVGSLVYLKDFSQIVNRKMKNIYKRTPYKVIGEYLNTVYIVDIFGRVSRHSKNNIRKVGERLERLFGALPQDIKLLLGDTMTPERSGDIITCATRILQFSSEMQQTWHTYYPRPQE
jgi:hypothetical protein